MMAMNSKKVFLENWIVTPFQAISKNGILNQSLLIRFGTELYSNWPKKWERNHLRSTPGPYPTLINLINAEFKLSEDKSVVLGFFFSLWPLNSTSMRHSVVNKYRLTCLLFCFFQTVVGPFMPARLTANSIGPPTNRLRQRYDMISPRNK